MGAGYLAYGRNFHTAGKTAMIRLGECFSDLSCSFRAVPDDIGTYGDFGGGRRFSFHLDSGGGGRRQMCPGTGEGKTPSIRLLRR